MESALSTLGKGQTGRTWSLMAQGYDNDRAVPIAGNVSLASRWAPHEGDRRAVGQENLLHDPKAAALIEGNVALVRRLKVGGDPLRIAPGERWSEQRSTNSAALMNRVRTESEQIVVWLAGMLALHSIEKSEPAQTTGAEDPYERRSKTDHLQNAHLPAAGRIPHRGSGEARGGKKGPMLPMQASERVRPEVGQARGTLVGIGQEPGHHGIILEGAGEGRAYGLQIGNRVGAAHLVRGLQGGGFALHE